ncbi:PucR family transcriptional regulator [Angustibacter luteus]|uniref:PucR family transcriptional regulator n=1 Tax=Angustibacter luteus TaxID=658456 RepID=A0ABW1JAY9_9ACTN
MTRVAEDRLILGSGLPRDDERPSTYGISVREALDLPALAGTQVLAGATGLGRHVLRLGVWETPDVLPFTREDELLVTTGYPLLERRDELADRFAELAEAGVVAVAVKLGAYVESLPADVLERADRIGLPVLALPAAVSLDDVLNQVLSAVLGRQAALLARSEEIHRALVQVVLGGGGLPEVANAIADGLGLSVLVTSPTGQVLAEAGPPTSADQSDDQVEVPIVAGGMSHGTVVALSRSGPIDPPDVHALERAAVVCALVAVKQQAVSAVEERYQADFLRDVLLGRFDDSEAAVRHGASLGWQLDRPLVVVTAQPDSDPRPGAAREPVTDRMASAWRAHLRTRDPRAAVCGFASEVVALVGAPGDGDVERLVRDLTAAVREPGAASGGRRGFTVGVSRVVTGIAGLAVAYEQSRTCVRVSRQVHGPGGVAHFDRLGVHRLLSLVPDSHELRTFLDETLKELAKPTAEARDLRRTLEALLDTNLNVAETARRLHFHYNTLRYRIGKLERILGPFTEDADLRLDLALALRIMPMRGLG